VISEVFMLDARRTLLPQLCIHSAMLTRPQASRPRPRPGSRLNITV